MTYILYATDRNGEGYVHKVGEYESLEDVEIRVKIFAEDVVITIEEEAISDDKN